MKIAHRVDATSPTTPTGDDLHHDHAAPMPGTVPAPPAASGRELPRAPRSTPGAHR